MKGAGRDVQAGFSALVKDILAVGRGLGLRWEERGCRCCPACPVMAGDLMAVDFGGRARRLRDALEPLAGGVYVAPEAYAAYVALGFDGPIKGEDGAVRPEPKAYFTSRGACMGRVSGEVVAAAFGCFNPEVVVPAVEGPHDLLPVSRTLRAG